MFHVFLQLQRRGLSHQGIQVDGNGAGLSLSLLESVPYVIHPVTILPNLRLVISDQC